MRENKPSVGNPLGKSKGFGFLSFKNHDDALACLRKVNNNPHVFGKNNVSVFNGQRRVGATKMPLLIPISLYRPPIRPIRSARLCRSA